MGCCSIHKWKSEELPDHKFNFIDMSSFEVGSPFKKLGYCMVFVGIARSVAILGLDIYSCISLLAFQRWAAQVDIGIKFVIIKWLLSGCIFLSLILLAWDWMVARKIIASKDIASAYLNLIAYRYYCCKGFKYYSLFSSLSHCEVRAYNRLTHSLQISVHTLIVIRFVNFSIDRTLLIRTCDIATVSSSMVVILSIIDYMLIICCIVLPICTNSPAL